MKKIGILKFSLDSEFLIFAVPVFDKLLAIFYRTIPMNTKSTGKNRNFLVEPFEYWIFFHLYIYYIKTFY